MRMKNTNQHHSTTAQKSRLRTCRADIATERRQTRNKVVRLPSRSVVLVVQILYLLQQWATKGCRQLHDAT